MFMFPFNDKTMAIEDLGVCLQDWRESFCPCSLPFLASSFEHQARLVRARER